MTKIIRTKRDLNIFSSSSPSAQQQKQQKNEGKHVIILQPSPS